MKSKFRGMALEGERLSRAEIKRRKEYLRIEALRMGKKSRKRKLSIGGEEPLADVHARKKVKLDRTCMGKSTKRCDKCMNPNPRLMRYKGMFGKKHLLCPVCGWTDRVVTNE